MSFQKVGFATARINGLEDKPYWFEHRLFYAWEIKFIDSSTPALNHMLTIKVGDSKEDVAAAEEYCDLLKANFKDAGISNDDKVVVLYGDEGIVKAIGCMYSNAWIVVSDKFTKKTFDELGITLTPIQENMLRIIKMV